MWTRHLFQFFCEIGLIIISLSTSQVFLLAYKSVCQSHLISPLSLLAVLSLSHHPSFYIHSGFHINLVNGPSLCATEQCKYSILKMFSYQLAKKNIQLSVSLLQDMHSHTHTTKCKKKRKILLCKNHPNNIQTRIKKCVMSLFPEQFF